MFDYMRSVGRVLITRLRGDADLHFLTTTNKRNGSRGKYATYDGKLSLKDSSMLNRFTYRGIVPEKEHIHLYSQVLYSKNLKKLLKVVVILDNKTKKYVLLCSTNVNQDALQVYQFYCLRFQIEFIFRDAKQFTSFTHSQSRKYEAMDFHFNIPLMALNIARAEMELFQTANSMNDYIRKQHNEFLLFQILTNLDLLADFDINRYPKLQQIVNLGIIND